MPRPGEPASNRTVARSAAATQSHSQCGCGVYGFELPANNRATIRAAAGCLPCRQRRCLPRAQSVSQGSHLHAPSLVAKACAQASFGAFRIEVVGLMATIRQGSDRSPLRRERAITLLLAIVGKQDLSQGTREDDLRCFQVSPHSSGDRAKVS